MTTTTTATSGAVQVNAADSEHDDIEDEEPMPMAAE